MSEDFSDFFIVDNSSWSTLLYLQEWAQESRCIDIATGFFEIGAFLALDGRWKKVEKIRILMGSETTRRTSKLLHEALCRRRGELLDQSIESNKQDNPFLDGVKAVLEGLESGQIEVKVYSKQKFHAKAYITHGLSEDADLRALVGSSNFTKPGLEDNVELNVQIHDSDDVALLQQWYEKHWKEAIDFAPDAIEIINRHVKNYSPFEVYGKALQEFFKGHELTANEWDEGKSKMFPILDKYQQEAYGALMKIARQFGGAFLCDGVGLGKTFVGLMLIERLVLHEGKRVVLFAPKAAKDGVWKPHLKEWLPHIGGMGEGGDFSNLAVFSHTDLDRKGDFPGRFRRMAELADAVIIDEAHHFRNRGSRGNEEMNRDPSRYYKLFNFLDDSVRPKSLFMLTATPVNNRLNDFRHMVELFSRADRLYFSQTLGINNINIHFSKLEKQLFDRLEGASGGLSEHIDEVQDALDSDYIFSNLVVQRSRSYARESQMRQKGEAASFPDRNPPKVAEYSIRKTYGRLLDLFDEAFRRSDPLFTLPIYYPLAYYSGSDADIDPMDQNRQRQVVGLIRTNFLKRFESSVSAFERSCDRLLRKLMAFIEVHNETEEDKLRLQQWSRDNAEILGYAEQGQLDLFGDDEANGDEDDFDIYDEVENTEKLDRDEYRIPEMIDAVYEDLDRIVEFLTETRKFEPKHDDKLKKLIRLLKSKELENQKVLIFTEFADTARYLFKRLEEQGIDGLALVDGSTPGPRRLKVVQRFAPYYNGMSSALLAEEGMDQIRVLISTDVLSEGLNLQDASRMMNYDIHWNPVRLMQRVGRVDRRMNPEVEKRLIKDHPDIEKSRGKISFWNFLPPEELNALLTLYTRVTQKTLLISETLGIEHGQLITGDDDFNVLKDFNSNYDGKRTRIEDLHLEYQDLLNNHPELAEKLRAMPGSVFSGREKTSSGSKGVFFCYALPALDTEENEFTEEAGSTCWYFYNLADETILDEAGEISELIRSDPDTPRQCEMEKKLLIDLRGKVEKHIKNTYLKQVNAPMGIKPSLKCWMELN